MKSRYFYLLDIINVFIKFMLSILRKNYCFFCLFATFLNATSIRGLSGGLDEGSMSAPIAVLVLAPAPPTRSGRSPAAAVCFIMVNATAFLFLCCWVSLGDLGGRRLDMQSKVIAVTLDVSLLRHYHCPFTELAIKNYNIGRDRRCKGRRVLYLTTVALASDGPFTSPSSPSCGDGGK